MNDVVQSGATSRQQHKPSWLTRLVTTVAPPLALIMYLILVEQYGFPLLNLNCDEQVSQAGPKAAR